MAERNDERLYQGPESGDVYSGPQPNTAHSPSNSFSIHSLLRPTPQQPHRPPPPPDQPVYPPLLQPAHPYANTGTAYNVTGMSAYPSNTSYPQLPYYRPPASSLFSASQPTHGTQPWVMSQYPYMDMNTSLRTTDPPHPPYPPPFQHPPSYPEYYPQVPTDSLPTGPGPPGVLPGLPVNTSGAEIAEGDSSNNEELARELHQAVKDGEIRKVKNLLQMNITASHQLYWSDEWDGEWPPLQQACIDDELDIVKMLIKSGVDVNRGDAEINSTPLHQACAEGLMGIVNYLIGEVGCEVDVRDKYNTTILHDACSGGSLPVVQYLVEEVKCDVDVRDNYNRTILHEACSGGSLPVVQYLVEEVKCDVDVRDDEGHSPLDRALENGHVDVPYYLFHLGYGKNKDTFELLCNASLHGKLNVVQELVEQHKVDPNAKDEDNWSPLHSACGGGHLDVVEYLVKNANCDVNARDKDNRCPLHLACKWGYTDVVRFLVDKANCDVNVTDDRGRTPLDRASERATDTGCPEDMRKRCTEIAEYLKSLPTEHSDGQKRVSSENHERRSPPAKQASSQNVSQVESTQVLSDREPSGAPLSEEEVDALQRLVQKTKMKLPSSQLTFEKVQQLLRERGLEDLATNLRAELDKVVKEQKQYLKQLEDLMTDKDSQNIRYLKTFLVGPPGVGKTTTLNRLLKVITNIVTAGDKAKIPSTLLANCIHVFAFVSGDGTEWISSSDLNQESILLFRYLCGCKLDILREQSCRSLLQQSSYVRKHFERKPVNERRSIVISQATSKDVTNDDVADHALKRSRIHNFITRLQKLIISEDHLALLKFLGSTLININDVGGQPGFLEMLPALSTGPAMYLVFFDLSKKLDKPYRIPFNREDTVISPYDAVHTVEGTISQILSAVTSAYSISRETSQFNMTKAADFKENFERFQQVKPIAAIIGTHKDQLEENAEQKLENINKSVSKITSRFRKIVIHPSANRCFFAVNNATGTDRSDVGPIRDFLSNTFQTHFKDATLPIRPKWLWLSLILRREFRIVSFNECYEIAEYLEINQKELEFVLWYLNFCTGTLMYYPDIPDEWFKAHIICSPQVVFDSISELIVSSLRSIHCKGSHSEHERMEMMEMGQFSLESIDKYCASYQVKKSLMKVDLIPSKQLVQLLDHVNLLSPIIHTEDDGSKRITYFMPAVLECAPLNELTTPPPLDANNPEPVLITFSCGYVPTGSFCGLITRLVSLGPEGILGLEWELVEKGVKRNCVSFYVDYVHCITLICHDTFYEIRVVRNDSSKSLLELCTYALSAVLYTLRKLYEKLVPQIAFKCPCSKHNALNNIEYVCTLVECKSSVRVICGRKPVTLRDTQQVWLGTKNLHLGQSASLEVLKQVEKLSLRSFSFDWSQIGNDKLPLVDPNKPNLVSLKSVSEEDLGYYRCVVKETGKVVLTVFRAIFRAESPQGDEKITSSKSMSGAQRTLTLDELEEIYSISGSQLDCEIENSDMIHLAQYFDNVEFYLSVLGLSPAEQIDVRRKVSEGTQIAMNHCLLLWKQHNPSRATLRTLLEILLSLKKEEIASNVCSYFCPKNKN